MEKRAKHWQAMWQLLAFVRPLSGFMAAAITMGIGGFLMAIFLPVTAASGILFTLGLPGGRPLNVIFITLAVFALFRGILRYLEQMCNHYIAFRLLALIRDRVFAQLRRLAPAKLEGKDKGNLISIITSDIELLEVFYAHTISPVCIALVVSLLMTLYIGSFHPLLGGLALTAYLSVGIWLPARTFAQSAPIAQSHRQLFGEIHGYFLDCLRGLNEIWQFGQGERRLEQFQDKTLSLSQWEEKLQTQKSANQGTGGFLILLFTLAMLLTSSWLHARDLIGFEGILLSTVAMSSSFGAVLAIANLGGGLSPTLAAAHRVLDLLREEPVLAENTQGLDIEFSGASMDGVDFAYDKETVLKDFHLSVPQGQITGLWGKSGRGKSTALRLLMRFWDRDAGEIRISGQDICRIRTGSLRQMESFLTQETSLFRDTLANNLRAAKPDASQEELEAACKKAALHDFILQLPQGYETPVGELGDTLSGGERQRLGLARAFLYDAPLMLLDEPTSHLDSLNEAMILRALKEDKGRSIVLVSHRPSTMTIADSVHTLEGLRHS